MSGHDCRNTCVFETPSLLWSSCNVIWKTVPQLRDKVFLSRTKSLPPLNLHIYIGLIYLCSAPSQNSFFRCRNLLSPTFLFLSEGQQPLFPSRITLSLEWASQGTSPAYRSRRLIWSHTCQFAITSIITVTIHYSFFLPLQAQNSGFPQILSSVVLLPFHPLDWLHRLQLFFAFSGMSSFAPDTVWPCTWRKSTSNIVEWAAPTPFRPGHEIKLGGGVGWGGVQSRQTSLYDPTKITTIDTARYVSWVQNIPHIHLRQWLCSRPRWRVYTAIPRLQLDMGPLPGREENDIELPKHVTAGEIAYLSDSQYNRQTEQ